MARKTIADWIREVMIDDAYGKIVCIICSHDLGFGPLKEVDNITFGERQWDPLDLEKRFQGKVENFAGSQTGRHNFILQAVYDTSMAPRNEYKFFYDVNTEEYRGLSQDAPTKEGLFGQLMRHNQILFKQSTDAMSMVLNTQAAQTERLSSRNEFLEKEADEARKIISELAGKLLDKRQEHTLENLKYQRNTQAMSMWMKMIAPLANQILGKEIFPQGVADSALIEAAAESMSDDDIEILSQKLKPELWGILANRFTEVLEKRKLEKERDERLLSHKVNPEDNASGEKLLSATTEGTFNDD